MDGNGKSRSPLVTTSTSFELASSNTRVTSIKSTKQQLVSQWVSQLVTRVANAMIRLGSDKNIQVLIRFGHENQKLLLVSASDRLEGKSTSEINKCWVSCLLLQLKTNITKIVHTCNPPCHWHKCSASTECQSGRSSFLHCFEYSALVLYLLVPQRPKKKVISCYRLEACPIIQF